MIEEQLKKQMRLAARKQHYYAISEVVSFLVNDLRESELAIDAMKDGAQGEYEESEAIKRVPEEVLRAMAFKVTSATLHLYQITQSLASYKQAFGEYPEWVKFTPPGKKSPEAVAEFCTSIARVFQEMSKRLGPDKEKKDLIFIAFGERFTKAAEAVKLKGEA